jgi:hypothetical protein
MQVRARTQRRDPRKILHQRPPSRIQCGTTLTYKLPLGQTRIYRAGAGLRECVHGCRTWMWHTRTEYMISQTADLSHSQKGKHFITGLAARTQSMRWPKRKESNQRNLDEIGPGSYPTLPIRSREDEDFSAGASHREGETSDQPPRNKKRHGAVVTARNENEQRQLKMGNRKD